MERLHTGMYRTWILAVMLLALASLAPAQLATEPAVAPTEAPTAAPLVAPTVEPTTAPLAEAAPTEDAGEPVIEKGEGGLIKELHAPNYDVRAVLMQVAASARKNIVFSKNVTGTVSVDLYDVTPETALKAITTANALAYEIRADVIYVWTAEEHAATRRMSHRVIRLRYIQAEVAANLVASVLSPNAKVSTTPAVETGLAPSSEETGGKGNAASEVLVIYDYEENLNNAEAVLKELDVRPDQILIEATILRALLTEDNAMGIDLDVLAGVNFNAFAAETNMQGVTLDNAAVSDLNNRNYGVSMPFGANVPEGNITVGLVTDHVAVFLRALESITDVTVMANPKLLVVNNQRGEVMVGNRDGYLTTTVTASSAVQTVEFLETGTRLIVRPFIGRDDYIRMEVHPEVSTGSVTEVGSTALPNEQTTEATSNVMVRDGRTIVIGGLFRETVDKDRQQVPVAGNIPYLGQLFRSTVDTASREEVIVLITPHIIRHEPDEAVSEQIKMDAERYRVGARRGLEWWSTTRLADMHCRWARENMRDGAYDKAKWNVDMALSMSPHMIEAIRIREQLLQAPIWKTDVQQGATEYVIQRMIMQELGRPVEEVTPSRRPFAQQIAPEVRQRFGIIPRPVEPLDTPLIRPSVTPAPVAPVAPTVPSEPAEPVAPLEPAAPIVPTEPSEPIVPTEPVQPLTPLEPTPPRTQDNEWTDPAELGLTPLTPVEPKVTPIEPAPTIRPLEPEALEPKVDILPPKEVSAVSPMATPVAPVTQLEPMPAPATIEPTEAPKPVAIQPPVMVEPTETTTPLAPAQPKKADPKAAEPIDDEWEAVEKLTEMLRDRAKESAPVSKAPAKPADRQSSMRPTRSTPPVRSSIEPLAPLRSTGRDPQSMRTAPVQRRPRQQLRGFTEPPPLSESMGLGT